MIDKNQKIIDSTLDQEYKYGFTTDIEQTTFEPGLNEDVITRLSQLKKRASMVIGLEAKSIQKLAKNGRTYMGSSRLYSC